MNSERITPSGADGQGFLTVRVTTARGAIPLEGATVTVTGSDKNDSGVKQVFVSGADGLTPRIALSAPPRANSEGPNRGTPFYTYNIEIVSDGYYTQYYYGVPVFEGINAMQTAELVALPENGIPDRFTLENSRFFEGENPDL